MYKMIREKENLPRWIKMMMYIVLTVTCVYWVGYIIYKVLSLVRFILHSVSSKEHWWFTVFIVIGVGIAMLLFMEFRTESKPFTELWIWIEKMFNEMREKIGNFLLR